MPPKADVKTLTGKRDNAIRSLEELFEEFETIFEIQPNLERLQATFDQVESKYRNIQKQQETIADKLVEEGASSEDERVQSSFIVCNEIRGKYLQIMKRFATYQKQCTPSPQASDNTDALKAMTDAVKKMAECIGSKPNTGGLERLPVPAWDGNRRTYKTWKKEFVHWMTKYKQDSDEQLQRFRKAMPAKGFWWTEQTKNCKSLDQAWSLLDLEFGDKRKLTDELLAEINSQKPVKRDSKSLTQYATTISSYANDMEDNECSVLKASEAPFFMSQLLSKLDTRDNTDFGREMRREGKEENVTNLVDWLHQEASLRSRGKRDPVGDQQTLSRKSESHAVSSGTLVDETCPLACSSKHLLAACPVYQSSSVSQRWEIVKQHKRCRKCLRASHHTNDCMKPDGTSCDKCKKNHHRSLHNDKLNLNPNASPFTSVGGTTKADSHNLQGSNNEGKNIQKVPGICPVQRMKVRDRDGNFMDILAMLDTGSNTSLLSKKFAKQLGLSGPQIHLTMNLAGGQKKAEISEVLEILIASPYDDSIQKTLQVHTVQKPCSGAKTISRKAVENYDHLKTISDKLHLSGGTVDLLIGTDFSDAFVDVHTSFGKPGDPVAKRNCFGWYILGQMDSGSVTMSEIQSVSVGTVSAVEDVKKLLHQDVLGVKPTKLCTCSDNVLQENAFVKSLSKSTTLVDGRIQVRMPWKECGPPRHSNYDIAVKRMLSAERSFQKKNCFKVVDAEVQKLLDLGFVSKVSPEQVNHSEPEWYMPLQAVFTPGKTTTVRLVFDSSAKGRDGLSLNDRLEKGPNYINDLINVLMAWRWDEVAYAGDVRKMFNQILVHPDDQIYHRFLWRSNTSEPPNIYQWLRLNFGDKPAPDIASNSINTLAKISQSEFPEAAKELKEHTYVDDIGGSRPTLVEAKQITNEIDVILGRGQFHIKAWHSNNKEIDQSDGERTTDLLGHRWDKEEDKLFFKKDAVVGQIQNFTKRSCLAFAAQLWDPLGLVSPVSIKFRIDFQELWSQGFGWDDIIPKDVQQRWMKNVQTMNELLNFKFDRKLRPNNAVGFPQVHGFSDGGEQGFGAVIFLRWQISDGNMYCVPVIAKAFVAPLKKKSIPRLELLGCLTLSRMYDTCKKALEFAKFEDWKRTLWVDSTTALSWIRTPPRQFRPFVSARVAEIQETVGTEDFRYVGTKCNPADALTRGIEPEQLASWIQGPEFLKEPEKNWPDFEGNIQSSPIDDKETLKEKKSKKEAKVESESTTTKQFHANEIVQEEAAENPILSQLLKNCSSFSKARRSLAYVHRFVQNSRNKNVTKGPITVQELKFSESQLYIWCQNHIDFASLDKKIFAKVDENKVLRAHGRLENIRSLPEEMRNPVLLPHNHQLVHLILRNLHEKRGHCGYKSLMYEARKKFWIIGLRSIAKLITRKCIICKKLRKKPLEQLMGQVPSLRVASGFPVFSNTAIDMFGPLHIKLNRKTLKEAQVIIFACMTSRAIHLELVSDKSADVFLMAFRRFASLRGHPNNCWSDCGTNFVGAQEYLNEIMQKWDIPKIQSILSEEFTCEFKWHWNTPHASHQNGVVETLIKSVRQALNSSCRDRAFTEEQWRTHLSEVTYMVNSRPLYPSSDDIWETPPITPNDILIGHHCSLPQPEAEDKINPRHLIRSTQSRVQEFWSCWMKYFAPNLLPRNKWFKTRENLNVGDLVLQIDPKHKRSQWEMALIVDVYPGQDGLVRKVRIKTKDAEYDRPIHKLCLIATKEELQSNKS